MSALLEDLVRQDRKVVRATDFPGRRAGPELRRLARAGVLLRLAHGYFALVPEEHRDPGTTWRPSVEAAALAMAIADYGPERVALLGPSAARLLADYPRALSVAVVAAPSQRTPKETTAGRVRFVLRDVGALDLVRVTTELGSGWATSVEETLLDLAGNWPRWPVSDATRAEMLHHLAEHASWDLVVSLGSRPGRRQALGRIRELRGARG